MCFLFEMKFLQGKNYIPFIIYIFTRTQTCTGQCLINIRSDFASVTFLPINFNLIGLGFTVSLRNSAFTQYHIISYHHSIHFIWSFIHPSIQSTSYIQTGFLLFSSGLGKLSLMEKEVFQALWSTGSLSQVFYSTCGKSTQNNT